MFFYIYSFKGNNAPLLWMRVTGIFFSVDCGTFENTLVSFTVILSDIRWFSVKHLYDLLFVGGTL